MAIEVTPLTPTLGAEIAGADLVQLDDDGFAEIFDAFVEHSVLFFRDQPALTEDQHFAFAERFGEVHVHPFERLGGRPSASGVKPGLLRIRTTAESTVAAGNRWHSDVSCDEEPPQASILQLHEIPPVGGDTLFASLYAAYEALSDRMKQYLDGLTARHSGEDAYRRLFKMSTVDPSVGWPEVDHPIVRRHADSGRPALYVDREFTHSINELPKEEARALLEFLFDHCERANFQCRFRWSANAIAIWDNRCVLHHAMWDYWPHERRGNRISIKGERPIGWRLGHDQVPADRQQSIVRLTA
ncbi:MAG: TauD/TfdA family dioxygenase [Acidimicrobiia bacterium]|nr:TauD/TfdA family dioxygenase [Acidimicrobiia bacterium]